MGPLKRLTRRRPDPPAEDNPRLQAHPMPGWVSIVAPPDDAQPEATMAAEPVPVVATPGSPSDGPAASPIALASPTDPVGSLGAAEDAGLADAADPANGARPAEPAATLIHAPSDEEHPYDRLDCPACGTIFRELPDAEAACPACDATIHVLTCPEGVRHLLTAADLEAFDDDWDALHARRKREEAQRRNAIALRARRATLDSYIELGVRLVELRTAPGACSACVAAAGRPYRPRAAPTLPIPGCRSDNCRCMYAPARPSPSRR